MDDLFIVDDVADHEIDWEEVRKWAEGIGAKFLFFQGPMHSEDIFERLGRK